VLREAKAGKRATPLGQKGPSMRAILVVLATLLVLGSVGLSSTASAHVCLHGAADPPSSCNCGDITGINVDIGPKVGPTTFTHTNCLPS
jgi:hypothetical protein